MIFTFNFTTHVYPAISKFGPLWKMTLSTMIDDQIPSDSGLLQSYPLTLTHSTPYRYFQLEYSNVTTYPAYHSGRDKPSRAL